MNFIIDIGNTKTKIAVFNNETEVHVEQLAELTPEFIDELLLKFPLIDSCIVSPVGDFRQSVNDYLHEQIAYCVVFDANTKLPVKVKYNTPKTLGKDRLAGVVAASNIYKDCDVLVIDLGTAVTYDIINKSGEYLGGNISPGVNTRFKALNHYTDKLPLVRPSRDFVDMGQSTDQAILSGVMNGVQYEIEGYMNKMSQKFSKLKTVLTGGDSSYFVGNLKSPIFVHENLILVGLNIILQNSKLQK